MYGYIPLHLYGEDHWSNLSGIWIVSRALHTAGWLSRDARGMLLLPAAISAVWCPSWVAGYAPCALARCPSSGAVQEMMPLALPRGVRCCLIRSMATALPVRACRRSLYWRTVWFVCVSVGLVLSVDQGCACVRSAMQLTLHRSATAIHSARFLCARMVAVWWLCGRG